VPTRHPSPSRHRAQPRAKPAAQPTSHSGPTWPASPSTAPSLLGTKADSAQPRPCTQAASGTNRTPAQIRRRARPSANTAPSPIRHRAKPGTVPRSQPDPASPPVPGRARCDRQPDRLQVGPAPSSAGHSSRGQPGPGYTKSSPRLGHRSPATDGPPGSKSGLAPNQFRHQVRLKPDPAPEPVRHAAQRRRPGLSPVNPNLPLPAAAKSGLQRLCQRLRQVSLVSHRDRVQAQPVGHCP
jgi:hypothetical protein